MTSSTIWDLSTTPASVSEIGGATTSEGGPPSQVNDAIRALAAFTSGALLAVSATGTNTITATATPAPSAYVTGMSVAFIAAGANTGAATLNLNSIGAKNLYKPGTSGPAALVGGEIQTGQVVTAVYDGTQFVMTSPVATPSTLALTDTANTFTANQTISSTAADAAEGPILTLDRNSASPAANDVMGGISFVGRDSAANSQTYADIIAVASDPTSGSEDGLVSIRTAQAGSSPSSVVNVAAGLWMQGATGGDPGSGGINATTIKKGGVAISGLKAGTALTLNPYATSSNTSQAHGLGVKPPSVSIVLECLTAEQGYSVGDQVPIPAVGTNSAGGVTYSFSMDATNLTIHTNASLLPQIMHKTTNGTVAITAANWKLIATPYNVV